MLSTLVTHRPVLSATVFAVLFGVHAPDQVSAGGSEFEGRIEAVERSDVYSRAEGIVEEVLVEQGDYVEAGTPLLQLRNDLEKLAVDAARAELAKAEALLLQARDRLERAAQLSTRGAATEVALLDAETTLALAEAERALAETELEIAKTNYADTLIRAPISGHVEDPRVGPGSLVEFNSGDPPLFQLVNLDRLRVVFEVPYAQWVSGLNTSNTLSEELSNSGRFRVETEIGRVLPNAIQLTGSAVWFDENSGEIRVWADLENPDQTLRPGMKVRVTPMVDPVTDADQDHSMVRP
ncbi:MULTISPECIES: efflux RND transporter periplasmic adaptor subunit [unclassified Ruegeria]|uniref:efflux RND transporter periplasmic adaptor subunit n=1 Tax=unclassified Ruegeria TaxID=2625375 RepID=UPI0014879BB7|nr:MULTISPECIES: efflux RND transporter periplasmic adaptor subunit [unclassified Ruegeria]NOD62360.1 efflux RND transporter periplasmic adaptor subunit [Ruegeria sp. HKCCD6109]